MFEIDEKKLIAFFLIALLMLAIVIFDLLFIFISSLKRAENHKLLLPYILYLTLSLALAALHYFFLNDKRLEFVYYIPVIVLSSPVALLLIFTFAKQSFLPTTAGIGGLFIVIALYFLFQITLPAFRATINMQSVSVEKLLEKRPDRAKWLSYFKKVHESKEDIYKVLEGYEILFRRVEECEEPYYIAFQEGLFESSAGYFDQYSFEDVFLAFNVAEDDYQENMLKAAVNSTFLIRWFELSKNNYRQQRQLKVYMKFTASLYTEYLGVDSYRKIFKDASHLQAAEELYNHCLANYEDSNDLTLLSNDYYGLIKLLTSVHNDYVFQHDRVKEFFTHLSEKETPPSDSIEELLLSWSLFNSSHSDYAIFFDAYGMLPDSEAELAAAEHFIKRGYLTTWLSIASEDRRVLYNLKLFLESLHNILKNERELPDSSKNLFAGELEKLREALIRQNMSTCPKPEETIKGNTPHYRSGEGLSLVEPIEEALELLGERD